MEKKISKASLYGEWIHSKEEDTEDEVVYRPANYDFPLSRSARATFQFGADGKLVKGGSSPSDSSDEIRGSWDLKANKIAFYYDSKLIGNEIISFVDKDKLVLKKS